MLNSIPSRRGRRHFVSTALVFLLAMIAIPTRALATGTCGDGIIDAGEECDDSNAVAGDGCSDACLVEPCFACAGEPSMCAPDDGAPCDDGLFCNGADSCSAGSCTIHGVDPCPGPNGDSDCSESCDEATDSCAANDPDGSACTDTQFCNGADTCSAGTCNVHAGNPCPGADGDADCSETCNEATDACTTNDPNGSACDDGVYCNGIDFCASGTCSAHTSDPCPGPDGDANCSESCNEATDSCTAADPNGSSCTDDLFCTGADSCSGGTCNVQTGNPCPGPDGDGNCSESCNETTDTCTAADPNGSACNDGTFCNGADTCSGGTCSFHPGDPCPGADGDANCSEMCNETTDSCTAPDPNGSACDDGFFCTGLDFCASGTCSAHTNDACPAPDGDGDCSESCDESTNSCTGADPNGASCNDGLFCTGADFCAGGACASHPAPPCAGPDGDAECAESCDEATQSCSANDPNGSACNDGLYCTVGDGCSGGTCGGAPRDCNAVGDQCHDGVCDENADGCVGPPKPEGTPCNDNDRCTVPDTCDDAGTCIGTPDAAACLDDFTCYKVGATSGSVRFAAQTNVTLTDQFRTSTVNLTKPRLLCSPTNNDGSNPEAPTHPDHLEDYQLKPVFAFSGAGTRTLTNQFGTVVLEVQKPVALMAPTLASLATPPGPLAVPAVDHFQCYRVKVATGQPKFQRFQVPITDEFGLRLVTVMKPRRLCAPADLNGTSPNAEMHPNHLLCYQIKEFSLPKFARVSSIFVYPPFGPETLDAKKPDELCVPSLKSP